ncbi:MAG: sulfotransferase [Sphingosinicella sp.]|nr:sulfotransferase [Sphingosinicella sp.]
MPSRNKSPKRDTALHRSRIARIEQALGRGDIAQAATIAAVALAAGQVDPMVLNLAAWRCEEAGDYSGAHRLLQRALDLAPGDVLVLGAIGSVLRKEARFEEALAVLDRVVAAEPRHAAAWLERGFTLEALRSERLATESYKRALTLDPNLAPALGKLADGAARRGDTEEALGFAGRAVAIDPLQPAAVFALAAIDIEAGEGARAEARLRKLLSSSLKNEDQTRTLTLLGDALDRQDRCPEAFAAYVQAQEIFRSVYSSYLAPTPESPSHRDFIEKIAAQVRDAAPATSPIALAPVQGETKSHIFLLGYPRSGTTLVENILASAAEVVALEEHETLVDTEEVLVANDGTMADLDALDPDLVAKLRASYWERVRGWAGDVTGRVFVDMNPLNGIKLPVIARLFPDARILIMRRDPRDVVLSCFRINFVPSPAAYSFSNLEETARHYDALMRLTELCRERLPLAFHEVSYGNLITDFETTVCELADFVGIEWTEDFRAFGKTARRRGVRTASATQVRRGLYNGGGRWRRYRTELATVLPILEPWVRRFHFEP